MPSDIKAMLSVVVLIVAAAFAYWEYASGNTYLTIVTAIFGVFAVIAMWVFPEAVSKAEVRSRN